MPDTPGVRVGPATKPAPRNEPEKPAPRCMFGHLVPAPGLAYCPECGVQLGAAPERWTCLKGHRCEPSYRFCGACGAQRPWPNEQSLVPSLMSPPRYNRPAGDESAVMVHFVEDGWDFAGRVWLRSQELEVVPGSPRWAEAMRWINLTPEQQLERYGKVYFRPGKWPGDKQAVGAVRRVPGA